MALDETQLRAGWSTEDSQHLTSFPNRPRSEQTSPVISFFERMVAITRLLSPELPRCDSNVERFRARQRRMLRINQREDDSTRSSRADSLDEREGRRRKISANWSRKQERTKSHDDGNWPQPAGTEMHMGYNAFDFSTCPEAFFMEEDSDQQGHETLICGHVSSPQHSGVDNTEKEDASLLKAHVDLFEVKALTDFNCTGMCKWRIPEPRKSSPATNYGSVHVDGPC